MVYWNQANQIINPVIMGFFSGSNLKPRVGHKISGQLATQALSRNLDSRTAGKSFSGRLSGRAFRALKKDPEIARHLSGTHKGFRSEVPEEIVHRAQEKLAQEKFIKYGARKDSYKLSQGLSRDVRKSESMYGHDKKDALKFLKLGEKEYQKQVNTDQIDPAKVKKEIKKNQAKIALFSKLGLSGRAAKLKNDNLGLEIKLNPEKEKIIRRQQLNERLSEPILPQSNPENKDIDKSNTPPKPPAVDVLMGQ